MSREVVLDSRGMRFKLLLGALLLVGLFPARASAQISIWLNRGTSGFGASATLATSDDVTTVGIAGGYSWQGILDFDLGLLRHAYDPEGFAGIEDVVAYGIAPGVQYHPLKQGPGMPISVGIGAGYEQLFVQSDFLDDSGVDISAWVLTLSGSVYRFFRLGENVGVIPSAGIGLVHSSVSSDPGGSESDDDVAVQLSGNFAYLSGTTIFGVTPFIVIGDGTVFGVNLQVVFSQPGS